MIMDTTGQTAIVWTRTETALSMRSVNSGGDWTRQMIRLSELRRLQANWDGDGARAPSRELLDSVEHLLRSYRARKTQPPSRMVATADGTIAIEWQTPPTFTSLEITRPFEGDLLIEREGYRPEFRTERWGPPDTRLWTRVATSGNEEAPIREGIARTSYERGIGVPEDFEQAGLF
jgi:hypothetical protein